MLILEAENERETPRIDSGAQAKVAATTASDLTDEYLRARHYGPLESCKLKKHRGCWLLFDGRIFRALTQEELEADILIYLRGAPVRARAENYTKRIVQQLGAMCLIPNHVNLPARLVGGVWSEEPETVAFQNGTLSLQEYKERIRKGLPLDVSIRPHSPALVNQIVLPFDFDAEARCPQWHTFLGEILPDPESRALLQEIFGYCLTPDISQQKFFMFEGTGGNGKGVVTNVLSRVVGLENVSALPINRLGSTYELEVTQGKLVNIASEMKEKDVVAEELLKQFVGGDLLHFNPKFRNPYAARPTARLILSTNERPMFRDRSDGLWRRLIILPFPVTIPEDKRDIYLERKLAHELPGILNWALAGMASLYVRGAFQEPAASIAAKKEFQCESNNVRMFLSETCLDDERGTIDRQSLYAAYQEYCEKNGMRPLGSSHFYKEV